MFVPPRADGTYPRPQLKVWWILWAAILTGLILIYVGLALGRPMPPSGPTSELPVNLAGVVPLFVSIILRWLVLPRMNDPQRGFVLFIVGLALAEGCGLLGIFLGGPYRDSLFVLGVLGIGQWVPFYAKKLYDPKGAGFIPNN
jgi:hypothetical protein